MYISETLKAFTSIYKVSGDFVGFKVQHDVHLYFKVQGGLIKMSLTVSLLCFLSSFISKSVFTYVLVLSLYCRTLCSGSFSVYRNWILCSEWRQIPFFLSWRWWRMSFLNDMCVWEAWIISLQMLQINITWHCKTSGFMVLNNLIKTCYFSSFPVPLVWILPRVD